VDGDEPENYTDQIHLAKELITRKRFEEAERALRAAVGKEPDLPEAFNLLGVMAEMNNHMSEALKLYRAASALDPTYAPANSNLERATRWDYTRQGIDMGDKKEGEQ